MNRGRNGVAVNRDPIETINKNSCLNKWLLSSNKTIKPYPEPVKENNDYANNTCTFKDIIDTLTEYGYKSYCKDDLDMEYEPHEDFCNITYDIYHSKSFFIYEISYPPRSQDCYFYGKVLIKQFPYITTPQLYIAINTGNSSETIRIPYINIFKDFVINVKLKHSKRCSICQEKRNVLNLVLDVVINIALNVLIKLIIDNLKIVLIVDTHFMIM